MSGQEEFRELESALKDLPQKQLNEQTFKTIHQSILKEAERLDRKDQWIGVMKRSLAGLAAIFVLVFVGYILANHSGFDGSESAKMSEDKASGGRSAVEKANGSDRTVEDRAEVYFDGAIDVEAFAGAESVRVITDKGEIAAVRDIFFRAGWEDAKVSMERTPDFILNGKYIVWISFRDGVEILFEGENKYAMLAKEDSETLVEILTGKKPGD
ncbi:hypothetical protein D1B31_07290 [Neobacillus notoginsengisoli]|uniref:DUF4367 domain-containing protein n=1 Tax=Neobacillus notoginsengisoli TaxID=1578198 RepID=A0A417YVU2_9BACI|nr:hypothetical protein [Neobacillus notoginsengisoli]RHW41519.1 hypothetical protein D1B31_07290 [Neobacillus notoginsengisoli]